MRREDDGDQSARVDQEAFDDLYGKWNDSIYRYLVHIVGPGAVAEDLFQDTWMNVIQYHDQLRDRERFGPWVFRIARNLAFNHLRTRRRKGQVWLFSSLEAPEDHHLEERLAMETDEKADPRRRAIETQRTEILREVIATLDPKSQEIVQLRYFEHLTLAEVASVLDMPLGTVCTKVHRALKAIRTRMDELGCPNLKMI